MTTWAIEGLPATYADYLATTVAPSGGTATMQDGQVIINRHAKDHLAELDVSSDGAVEDTPDGLVMYFQGDAFPVRVRKEQP
jgi:hypothetical protein